MTVYKRSELTPDVLRQWQCEAQQEIIYNMAPTLFDLSMMISEEKEGGKVDIKENGKILLDGIFCGYWRKQGDVFIRYMPPVGQSNAKVIRGPW